MPSSRHRLLVVSRHCPLPENDGAGAYLFDLLSYLRNAGARVDVLWLQPDPASFRNGWYRVPQRFAGVATLHLPGSIGFLRWRIFPAIWWLPMKARSLHAVKKMLSLLPFFRRRFARRAAAKTTASSTPRPAGASWSASPSSSEVSAFRKILHRVRPESVLANYCWLAPLFDHVGNARKLVLTHDVASHRLPLTGAARYDLPADSNPALPTGEAALLSRADAILAISDTDAATFREMQPAKQVLVVPKSAPIVAPARASEPGRCLFVGGRNSPNEEGLAWFLREVWPQVIARHARAHLHICGAIGAVVKTPPDRVTVCGRVDDLGPEYAAAQVVVVPLLRGTGMKIKLVEAASHGKACVTTPVGLQGLSYFSDAVLCTGTAPAFAAHVVELLNNEEPRNRLAAKLQTAARQHLSPDACYGPVQQWLGLGARATPVAARAAISPA